MLVAVPAFAADAKGLMKTGQLLAPNGRAALPRALASCSKAAQSLAFVPGTCEDVFTNHPGGGARHCPLLRVCPHSALRRHEKDSIVTVPPHPKADGGVLVCYRALLQRFGTPKTQSFSSSPSRSSPSKPTSRPPSSACHNRCPVAPSSEELRSAAAHTCSDD